MSHEFGRGDHQSNVSTMQRQQQNGNLDEALIDVISFSGSPSLTEVSTAIFITCLERMPKKETYSGQFVSNI